MKHAEPAPQLRAARDLAFAEREVGPSAESEAGQGQRACDPPQDEAVAERHVAQAGMPAIRKDEREAEAAGAQQYGAASRSAPSDGDACRLASGELHVLVDPARTPQHHDRLLALPEAQDFELGRVGRGLAGGLETAEERLVERQVPVRHRQREVEQAHGRSAGRDDSTPVYLDCAATAPLDARVREVVLRYLDEEFGNAGSRTHDYGRRARRAVEQARDQVARVVGAGRGEVIFTSGATESDNLALLGLAEHGLRTGRTHVVSTAIEHHAVLGPLQALERRGFRVTLVPPRSDGWVEPAALRDALCHDTLAVSVMHVNNETGVVQPVAEIADALAGHRAFLHVDAAQGFGKELLGLRHPRIDLVSVSGHKLHAPKGVGALVVRRRGGERPPLAPLLHGGGQELGLRPGTLPVALIAGLGEAAELALAEAEERAARCRELRRIILAGLASLRPAINGDPARALPHILSLSFAGHSADSVIEAWEDLAAISDGAACTTQSRTCSHVLAAMGLPQERRDGTVRLSWCHLTPLPDLDSMVEALTGER